MKLSLDYKLPSLNRIFQIILIVLPLGVFGNVLFTLLNTDFKELVFHEVFRFQYLALAVVLGFIPWFTNAIKLQRWTRFFNNPISFSRALYIAIGTRLGSAATPTVVGGGYLKLGMLVQDGFSSGSAASLMILGSLEDILFMAAAVPAAVALCGGIGGLGLGWITDFHRLNWIWLIPVILAAAGTSALYLFLRHQHRNNKTGLMWLHRWGKGFVSDFRMVSRLACGKGYGILATNVLLSAVQGICQYQVLSAFMAFIGVEAIPIRFFLYQAIINLFGTLVLTPGGIGGIEAAFYFLFKPYVPFNLLALTLFGWRMLTCYLQMMVGAVVFMIMKRGHHDIAKPIEKPRSDVNTITPVELTA